MLTPTANGRLSLIAVGVATAVAAIAAQAPPASPSFDAVSVKRNTNPAGPMRFRQFPNGGLAMVNVMPALLMVFAFPGLAEWQFSGLPQWSRSERYDVNATGDPGVTNPTPAQRASMVQAMLRDRFGLETHYESREHAVYNLVLARKDGRLGPGLRPIQEDCAAIRAAAEVARAAGPPASGPPTEPAATCFSRDVNNHLEGDATVDLIATHVQGRLRQPVINKTGLNGDFHVSFTAGFEIQVTVATPGTTVDEPGTAPSIFTAVQEQLGLKLEAARAPLRVLVIDRFERPSEN